MGDQKLSSGCVKTVLHITTGFTPNIGGLETHLDDLCDFLVKRNYRVYVITPQPTITKVLGDRIEKRGNLIVHRIYWFGHLFYRLDSHPLLKFLYFAPMQLIWSLFFILKHYKEIDVIHAHGVISAFVAKVLGMFFKKRRVATIHTLYNLDKNPTLVKMLRMVLPSFDVILTLTTKSKEELTSIGLPDEKIKIFTHWVNQEVFRPLDKIQCKQKNGWSDKFIVLYVGRLVEIKGVRLLLEVAKEFGSITNKCFAFIGEGPLAEEIEMVSRQHSNIIYLGKIAKKHLPIYYNAADVVIMPALYAEPFGRVLLEAFSCGIPVIASNKGGIPEVLDSSTGVFVEPNSDEIRKKVKHLYTNRNELLQMAENCRRFAEMRYSEHNAKIIEESYVMVQ